MSGGRAQPGSPMRVVLDTNVVLSALLFRNGRLAGLRLAWQSGRLIPVVARQTLEELSCVLAYPKFGLTLTHIQAALALYLPYVEAHRLDKPHHAALRHGLSCRDPKDQVFLELAYSAAADALVTGDSDLRALGDAARMAGLFQVLTPQDLLAALKAADDA